MKINNTNYKPFRERPGLSIGVGVLRRMRGVSNGRDAQVIAISVLPVNGRG
jgi:hypothetical protein